ncbi:MAG: formyltetrahydrofolate deformylase [Alphaproteobacteria bacterium]|nr:formyltetrahydrofolate deformylase [Alphaproteobacteria bacterium]
MTQKNILKLSCKDQPGIVAAVSGYLFEKGANIASSAQFEDADSGNFFLRTVFASDADLSAGFAPIAKRFGMEWSMRPESKKPKILVMVSKAGHCISDLLYRQSIGDLPADILAIVGNHPRDVLEVRDLNDVPYHHLPVTPSTKKQQEAALQDIVVKTGADLVVLARYMQVLSDDFCRNHAGRIINIHHSFLPGFKGAKPYHQAHARGVKLIGATAHYVTADLDEGPIIEQDVERITHAATPDDMVAVGRDIERRVLTRAVTLHCQDRVCLAGHRTIIL